MGNQEAELDHMPFEHDVFISYPHLSNRDDSSGHNGWVAKFHQDLKLRLSHHLGRDARIWRDNKLPFGGVFSDAISARLRKSTVLLCVLSPAYVRSEWCLRELDEFCREAAQTGGLVVNDQSRIIPAIMTPIGRHPDALNSTVYCEFYDISENRGGAPREFSQVPGGYKHEEYKELVNQIAWAVKTMVELLGDAPPANGVRAVYLAETTSDQDDNRDKLKDELEDRKFVVLPSDPLPMRTAQTYADAVSENLKRSFMSVHLMGASYGLSPEGSQGKSIVDIQNDLAAKRSAEDKLFTRVIWIPEDLESSDGKQLEYLEALRISEIALAGAELIERPFESLKTRLIQKLIKPEPDPPPDDGLFRIYLMCDKQDADAISPVESFLFEKGFEVISPAEEGDEGQVIRYHKDNLLFCDATLILYGNVNRNWVRFCLDDLIFRAKGWGRETPILCKAILRTAPETEQKTNFRTRYASVLDPPCYDDKLSPASLEVSLRDFINCLESSLGTQS